jgi:hypothetical protein
MQTDPYTTLTPTALCSAACPILARSNLVKPRLYIVFKANPNALSNAADEDNPLLMEHFHKYAVKTTYFQSFLAISVTTP